MHFVLEILTIHSCIDQRVWINDNVWRCVGRYIHKFHFVTTFDLCLCSHPCSYTSSHTCNMNQRGYAYLNVFQDFLGWGWRDFSVRCCTEVILFQYSADQRSRPILVFPVLAFYTYVRHNFVFDKHGFMQILGHL